MEQLVSLTLCQPLLFEQLIHTHLRAGLGEDRQFCKHCCISPPRSAIDAIEVECVSGECLHLRRLVGLPLRSQVVLVHARRPKRGARISFLAGAAHLAAPTAIQCGHSQ